MPEQTSIRVWEDPARDDVGETVGEFLARLGGPTCLFFPGNDRTRTRAVSTLLHGNEPSGIHAIFHWIHSGKRPLCNLWCFIGSVNAALAPPGFAYRALPGWRDFNRCFREPFEGVEGKIAKDVLRQLRFLKPEALLDLHNTSGMGPCYAVSTRQTDKHIALTTIFSQFFILTDLRLGTLMEATEDEFPTVTVECGGAADPLSTNIAVKGLEQYATMGSIFSSEETTAGVTVLKHPIRVELFHGAQVTYAFEPIPEVDLTFRPDVVQYNFGVVQGGQAIGWLGARGLSVIRALDGQGRNRTLEIFSERNGCLIVIQPTQFFMITTDPDIARKDCLFYVIPRV